MSIDKALYTVNKIEPTDEEENNPIEIEIEGMEGDDDDDEEEESSIKDTFGINLAEILDEQELATLSYELIAAFDEDNRSREKWLEAYTQGLDLLAITTEERTEPWIGACGVTHPILTEAVVKFQAETMQSIFPSAGPVRAQIIGKETPAKKACAERVEEDMNYQLTTVMAEYRPDHERMLWGLGLSGNAFKKVYYDPALNRQVSLYVPSEDIVVPYGASDLQSAERITHIMRKTENEIKVLQAKGFYRDVELGEPRLMQDDVEKKISEKLGLNTAIDERYKILEIHVMLDLAGFESDDSTARPYVITIDKDSQEILAIRRNWNPDDETYKTRQHFVHYGYIPGFGFYCLGLIHLIGSFAKSGTSILRQLVDGGTLSNIIAGFKTRGLRIKGDDTPISPGEWRDVDVPSGTIRDNLMPLPYKEPSQTLYLLLKDIIEEGRRFANASDLQISDMSGQTPVGTTLALLERNYKSQSAIQARIHYSMKQELCLLKEIIAEYAPPSYTYQPTEGSSFSRKSDYKDIDVIPVSDPNASTMAQKIVQYQAVLQLAQTAPQLYNLPLLHRQMLEVLGIKNANKLVPMAEDQKPCDPISENQAVLMQKPVKAFSTQDHKAHIAIHMSAMQDPKILQLLQNNPAAPQMQAAMMAHVNEHLGFEYRLQIEQQLGFSLPAQTDESGDNVSMNPNVEAQLSPLLAQAATQLLQSNQKEQAQQQAQQNAQDPLVQMQMQEMQIKMAEQQRKAKKDEVDAQIRIRQQDIELARIKSHEEQALVNSKIDALSRASELKLEENLTKQKLSLDAIKSSAEIHNRTSVEHKKMGIDAIKTAAQIHANQKHNPGE